MGEITYLFTLSKFNQLLDSINTILLFFGGVRQSPTLVKRKKVLTLSFVKHSRAQYHIFAVIAIRSVSLSSDLPNIKEMSNFLNFAENCGKSGLTKSASDVMHETGMADDLNCNPFSLTLF